MINSQNITIAGVALTAISYIIKETFRTIKEKNEKIQQNELEKARLYEKIEKERIEEFKNIVQEIKNLVREIQETRVKDIQVAVRAEEYQKENKEAYIKISSKLDRLSDKIEANNLNIQELRVYIQSCPHVRNSVKLDTKEEK